MDINFSYGIQKIKNKGLLFHHPQVTCIYILSFLRIISIKRTIMEMLWPPLHQFARFTSATSKHTSRLIFVLGIFIESFSMNSLFIHKGTTRWYEEELPLLAEVNHFAERSSCLPNKHWKIRTQRAWACLPKHYSCTHKGDNRLLTKP
jgi:hypothetical protein